MGMGPIPPPTDVLGDCDVCGEPLARYGGHAVCDAERLEAKCLRLAQGLRVIRDSTSDYASNVARRALAEAGVADPNDESVACGHDVGTVTQRDLAHDCPADTPMGSCWPRCGAQMCEDAAAALSDDTNALNQEENDG